MAGGWKTCHVPRRAWLDNKIDVFLEQLAASGVHLVWAAISQVHATLALAAATAVGASFPEQRRNFR